MSRSLFAFLVIATAALAGPARAGGLTVSREHVSGDVYHYAYVVTVGESPNARLYLHRIVRERAPWRPRASRDAVMLAHGDFSSFVTSFAPALGSPASTETGMALFLAQRGIDVWGMDRRWARTPADGDVADFGDMGVAQELDDLRVGLAFARATRLVTGSGLEQLTLVGFSRGGMLAYAYASVEATRPAWQRHIKGLVPLDVYGAIAPEDEDIRQGACISHFYENLDLEAGIVDSPNGLFVKMGSNMLAAPDAPSPIPLFAGLTNREAVLGTVGQTYFIFPAAPLYHLAAPVLDGDVVTALRESPEDVIATWLAGAAPHQSLREASETDAILCGEAPLPVDAPLSTIRVPLFNLAAAGGYGATTLYSTTQVSSSDVTTLIVHRFGADRVAEDFGHGDMLFARDAETLVWQPLASWIQAR